MFGDGINVDCLEFFFFPSVFQYFLFIFFGQVADGGGYGGEYY